MIVKKTFFAVDCSSCGKEFPGHDDGSLRWWDDAGFSEENASEDGWHVDGKHHWCNDCYRYDENDELILEPIKEKK